MKISKEDAVLYADAIADVICWKNGFNAAGGEMEPVDSARLRALQSTLKDFAYGDDNEKS